MIALVAGDARAAAAEFDELARRYSRSDEAAAAVYWAGRAWARRGRHRRRPTSAGSRLAAGDPGSYYAGLAVRRLDRPEWVPPAAADSFVAIPAADSAMARAALLARLGLAAEARWEYDRLVRAERHLRRAAARPRQRLPARRPRVPGHPARPPRARPAARRPTPAPIGCSIPSCSRTRCWPRPRSTDSTPASSPR